MTHTVSDITYVDMYIIHLIQIQNVSCSIIYMATFHRQPTHHVESLISPTLTHTFSIVIECTHHVESPISSTIITTFLNLVEMNNIQFHLCWHLYSPTYPNQNMSCSVIHMATHHWRCTHHIEYAISPTLTFTFSIVIGLQIVSSWSK
jgi:hypothetical protein